MKNIRQFFLLMYFLMIATAGAGAQEQSLQNALNPDGTLRAGADGSYNTQGYEMRLGPNGEPMFMPQTQNTVSGFWDTQIGQPGLNNNVNALAVSGNNVYVGGSFTQAGRMSANYVARYNLTTNTWSSLGTVAQNGVNNQVFALAIDGLGRVYVGGAFTEAGGVSANRVARFDPATNTWSTLGTVAQNGVNGAVRALAIDGLGQVYVGGSFTQAGGVSARFVARFDPATNTWSTLGTVAQNGVNNFVYALAVVGNEVYVGGEFTSAGGVSANRVARFDPATNTWSTLGTVAQNGVNSIVYAFAIYGNDVIVGGFFTSAGGVSANRVARYSPVTNTWSALGVSGSGVNSSVYALVVSGDILFVGGGFTLLTPSNQTANRLASYNFATDTWSVFGSSPNIGMNDAVLALAMAGGNLLAGGLFTQAETTPSNRIAYSIRTPTVNIGAVTNISSTSATLSGTINPNGFPLTLARFEYSLDPTFTSGVTNVNTTPNASAIGSGTSPVSVSATITIQPNSLYFIRLRATNANGTSVSEQGEFTNLPFPFPASGLRLWLRADSLVTQTSGAVSQWNDLSPQSNHAIQSTPASRPLLVPNALNGRPVIRFDGVNDWLDGNIGTQVGRDRSLFIVYRRITFLGNGGIFSLRSASGNDWDSGDAMALTHGSTNSHVVTLAQSPLFYSGIDSVNTYRFLSIIRNVNSVTMRINGITQQQPTQNVPSTSLNTVGYRLGARASNGSQLSLHSHIDVAEVLLYNRGLSNQERFEVEAYLAAKYGLGISNSATPSVPQGTTGSFVLGNTGVTVTLTTASTTAGSLSGSVTNSRPNVVGSLPTGITNLAERFWTINQTNLTGYTCALTFDLSTLGGVQNFNNLKVLRRNNASSPWLNVETLSGVTITRNAPFITVAGITSFSDFTIGSDASNQLPVELTEFGFRKADSGIELVWKTATELNNAGFEVQRRSENRGASTEWQVLGFVRGNGTTTEAQSYSFLDRTAVGKVQYRLKQIDFDGQFEYSNIIEVDAGAPKVFALEQNYPNPFNPTTVISYQLPVASEVSLKVYDVLGREVMTLVNGRQEAGAYNFNFNASNLSSGVYFYRLQASATNGASSSNFVQTKKMMLVK